MEGSPPVLNVGKSGKRDSKVHQNSSRASIGFETRSIAGTPEFLSGIQSTPDPLVLDEEGSVPVDMVRIPGGRVSAWITGIDPFENMVPITEFFMDKYEVTNERFLGFIDAGGYEKHQYWNHEFVADGQTLSWDEAMATFVDATGRPGPSTWRLGDYPDGEENYPVTGLSWYEAAAYAEFTEKHLPTISHWIRAAETRVASFLTPLSNLQGTGPSRVGSHQAISPFGTHDMAGNVREWCWNLSEDQRYILGGGWSDPAYLFTFANVQSPMDRTPTNGFRLVQYIGSDDIPQAASGPVPLLARDYIEEQPVPDEVFQIYRDQFSYDQTDLDSIVERLSVTSDDWTGERVTFNAAYADERMMADVYLPVRSSPPYQAAIVFPGSNAIMRTSNPGPGRTDDFILRSGRALIRPVYKGTYERNDGLTSTWPNETFQYAEYLINWVKDLKRTIDYLETRPDINADRLAYYGLSWGGRTGAIVPAVEPRLKVAVLFSGGLASGRARPEVDQLNYVSRVTIPVLMLNGIHDAIQPLDAAQRPLSELLGTPEGQKRWVNETGHFMTGFENESIRDVLDWLDKYLGPVN